ncbi:MAG: GTPase Era [Bacilli bacterium]|nr:GTPase Era [Bacilli bacterium]
MKVGFVTILGRPNVGKSTLLNALLSKKVSIVTPRAQTTRDTISGILTEKDLQIVFVDTPGIFEGKERLYKEMKKSAFESSRDVNAILYLFDASSKSFEEDFKILSSLRSEAPRIFVLNKIDLIRLERAKEIKEEIGKAFPDVPLIEASFIENFGIKEVKTAVLPYLEEGDPFYPEDWYTDKDLSYQAKEVIREKLLHFLHQEIPHQSAVFIDSIKEGKNGLEIDAIIYLEKENHKGMVIGKGGEMIKKIRVASLSEMGRMWHRPISSLTLKVEVNPNWRNDPKVLSKLGYGES